MREQLAKDITDAHSLQWKSERAGSVDRITAKGFAAVRGDREAMMEALGCSLWGYKLPKTQDNPADEFEKLRKDRRERERHEAYLRLALILRDMPVLKEFKGRKEGSKMPVFTTGWYIAAVAAIDEWVDDLCRNCHGAGELIMGNGVKTTCPVCDGHRKHRYSDEERRLALEEWSASMNQTTSPQDVAKWNNLMTRAHDIIGTADRAMAERMGRILTKW